MRLLLLFLLLTNPVKDLNKVAEVNALKKEAKQAYSEGKFKEAINSYEQLTGDFGLKDDKLLLNMAHAYFKNDNREEATIWYGTLSESENNSIRSTAFNQLGVLANQNQKRQEAINYFKEAIKADPTNEAARFNYSKLKQEKEEQQDNDDQGEDNKDKDQENKDKDSQENGDKGEGDESKEENKDQEDKSEEGEDEENKDQQEGEEDKKDEKDQDQQDADQQSRAEKLEQMNMSEEKAEMILEAMKNNEIQYIQQNKKKPQTKVDDGRPDW